jgi:hypothetical protein
MRSGRRALAACVILLPVLCLSVWIAAPTRCTWFELTDTGTGRRIASRLLPYGEEVVLTWKNSLFGVLVTEVFVARGGILTLTEITFANPAGGDPPRVKPEDVNDLYQTGGPFKAEGLSRQVNRVIFRVGEIGKPVIRLGNQRVELVREVGFGGGVLLVARRPSVYELALGRLLGW